MMLFLSREKVTLLVPLLFLILLSACSSQEDSIVSFDDVKQLNGSPVEEITMFTSGNVGLAVVDTFLVVQRGQEPYFQIYSTNSHQLLKEFGYMGEGPGEFQRPDLLKQVSLDQSNNSPVVHAFDFRRQMFASINVLDVLERDSVAQLQNLPAGGFFRYFYHLDDQFLLGTPESGGRFLIHNVSISEDIPVPFLPKLEYEIPESSFNAVYRSAAVLNKERGLIAAAPLFLGELNYFDLQGNVVRSTLFDARDAYENELSQGGSAMENVKYQIEDLVAKNGLIYALNYNISVADNNQEMVHPAHTKVQVFDWEGNALREFQLDNRMIKSFAIDENHNRIYGYSIYEEDHTIISYSME